VSPREPVSPTVELGRPKTWQEDRPLTLHRINELEASREEFKRAIEKLTAVQNKLLYAVVVFGTLIAGPTAISKLASLVP